MKKAVIIYGLVLALIVILLKIVEYRLLVRDYLLELYIGALALIFISLGIWFGTRMRGRKTVAPEEKEPERINGNRIRELGISPREYEVLELIAQGLTNQEIADRLYVSLNTVKTHSSNLFSKLDVRRRTQAIRKAKEEGILL